MMKQIFTLLILLFVNPGIYAQNYSSQRYLAQKDKTHSANKINFNGQWKGGFDENGDVSTGLNDDIKYVLELTTDGSKVSGYSYTYFEGGIKKYYTICRLTGTLNREANELTVTEIERIKSNTPPNFVNYFQIHHLHYVKDTGNIEELRGTWIPAPNQGLGGGSGTTVLSRRVINPLPVGFLPKKNKAVASTAPKKTTTRKPIITQKPTHSSPHNSTAKKATTPLPKPKMQKPDKVDNAISKNELNAPETKVDSKDILTPLPIKGFENRRNNVVKTINIEQPTFKLDFYDNGEIDGDSITVFYNGKIVLSHKRLSDKPISLTLTLDKNAKENIVTMYADNLGTIPPNTALMVVTDGGKRYEVRMESDYGKSGTVVFKHNDSN